MFSTSSFRRRRRRRHCCCLELHLLFPCACGSLDLRKAFLPSFPPPPSYRSEKRRRRKRRKRQSLFHHPKKEEHFGTTEQEEEEAEEQEDGFLSTLFFFPPSFLPVKERRILQEKLRSRHDGLRLYLHTIGTYFKRFAWLLAGAMCG